MATKKTNGTTTPHDHRVSVDPVEYAALSELKETFDDVNLERLKAVNRSRDLHITCDAQARRLVELDLTMQHHERIIGLQRVFIDTLRADAPAVASLEDLSAFWKQWSTAVESHAAKQPGSRDEVSKLEPDLFRSWRLWVRDAGKVSRSFSTAGTRVEVDSRRTLSQDALQRRTIAQAGENNAVLSARVRELECELEAYRNADKDGKR